MDTRIKIMLDSNPEYKRYLRSNSYWYKTLNRNPEMINNFIDEVKEKYKLRTSFYYHSSTLAPQDSPAPKPAMTIFCPSLNSPFFLHSSNKIGMLAEDVFPYSCKFIGNFSISICSLLATASTIL